MKIAIINFFKGIIAGIGNIIPGISGSVLLIILDLYDKCIEAISSIFKSFKKNFLFLLPIALGVLVGIFSFSNIIELSLEKYQVATILCFVGLLIGTISSLFKETKKDKFKYTFLIPFFIALAIGSLLIYYQAKSFFQFEPNFINLIFVGMIISAAMIIPGLSNTALLTMIGAYKTFLSAINDLNISLLIPIIIGFALGLFFLAKLINILLKKYHGYTFYAIIGFVIATIPALVLEPSINGNGYHLNLEFIIGILLLIIGFIISYFLANLIKKNNLHK